MGKLLSQQMEQVVKKRIELGEGQPPYSTNPAWYSTYRPYGGRGKFINFMRSQGQTIREAQSSSMVFMPQGYAQWRSIYRGEGMRTTPVTFELTGQLMRNLTASRRNRPAQGEVVTWLAFKSQKRSYGKLTNEQLADILNRRGSIPPFSVTEEEGTTILNNAAQVALRELAQETQ